MDANRELSPGGIVQCDLRLLVQMIEPTARSDRLVIKDVEPERPSITGGSLLAGRELVTRAGQRSTTSSNPPKLPGRRAQVYRIPVAAKPAGRLFGWLVGAGISLVVLLGLAAFAWVVMKSSDFTDVPVFEGTHSGKVQLSFSLGERLPRFTGLILVEDDTRWGDTFSEGDLIGRNTVIFVWGSWNEDLLDWSRELNYQRLAELESVEVQFVGLNLDNSRESALAALNEDLVSWPQIFNYDERQSDATRPMRILGIQSSPLILLVDATGRLRGKGLAPDELVEAYRELFEKGN